MLNDEISTALARFLDGGKGPSHDELTRLVQRFGLGEGDPRDAEQLLVGKMKRVRSVLSHAIEKQPDDGWRFVRALLAQMRASGCFREGSENFPGQPSVDALREAFRRIGYELAPDGDLRPTLLENLDGAELTDALWAYVRRIRLGASDPALAIGTAKSLEEAAARHVLKERTGDYPKHGNFPATLWSAFSELGLQGSQITLDKDPYKAMQEALFLLACAVNRLRNEKGEGHGRPERATATALEGRLSTQAAGLITELLLSVLTGANRA